MRRAKTFAPTLMSPILDKRIHPLKRLILFTVVAPLALIVPEALAKTPPQLPCGVEPYPPFANDEAHPSFQVWTNADLPLGWRLPACADITTTGPRLVVAIAGTFRSSNSADTLAVRFGAISATKGIKYWSITDKTWRVLITDAAALTAADGQRRADFTVNEVKSGADLYFEQKDNRSSGFIVYRMRLRTVTFDRLSLTVENVNDVRVFGISVLGPGDLQSLYILKRRPPDDWTYYNLSIIGNATFWGGASRSSYVNRAIAFYRHFVGLPTDQEPPPAP